MRPEETRVHGTRGRSLLEVALVMPVVLLLFTAVYEFGRLLYTRVAFQHAVHDAALSIVDGSVVDTGRNKAISRDIIARVIGAEARSLDIDIDQLSINMPGRADDPKVVVSGEFSYRFVTPGIQNLFPPDGAHSFSLATSLEADPMPER